ncbi:zinc transport system substrate-binding protein [Desulfuromusa kysingii]|uniref:Zinc transport system substrate-binding protein n=1 Tax=Desulfuromusa kysingii TaxID=37625 RepID=A0A1H4DGN2_9BACT|nr:zinc ABC transporter substrate-binding protein [Desulfuromusa kysingii]SEA71915.1 zinc transport system substrate-binding protein [Desulfuromusa kysingii]
MKRIYLSLLLLMVTALPLWAAESAVPQVVVSIKPLHSLVSGVMQGVGTPDLVVKSGGSPHGYVLRPSEAQLLSKAQLVIWVGHELESFLNKPLATLGQKAKQLELADALEPYLLSVRKGDGWESHAHKHVGDDHDAHDDHHYIKPDQHLWLDPAMAKRIVTLTAKALVEIDPSRQDQYQANAEQMIERLDQLDKHLKEKLEPVKGVPYIVFHAAYQYLEAAYGLNAVGSITLDPGRTPGAKKISEIHHKIKELNAKCVFSEPQFESRLVATVIEGTNAKTGILDPLGADIPNGPDAYFELMTRLGDNLYEGLK